MPIFYNVNRTRGTFMIPAGATKSPTPAPPSFPNTKSLAFDGVDEYVKTPDNYTLLDGLENVAFSFWIKPTDSGTSRIILSIGTASADTRASQFQVFRRSDNSIQFYMASLSYGAKSGVDTIAQDQWSHILVTRDDSRPANLKVKIFINGVDETASDGTRFAPSSNSNSGLYIGEHQNGFNAPFLGNIDEVAIYNQDMATYIDEIYASGTVADLNNLDTAPAPNTWFRNGDNSTYQTPQILMPENTNKDKISNYSLTFDGVDDYVATSSLTGLGMGTTDLISVSLWFKTNATKTFPTAFNTGGWPLTSGVNIYLDSTTNNIGARVNNVVITTSGTNYRDDNWHHILLCYNGSLGSNQIELFVDGVSVGTNTLTGNITSTTTDIHIGANTNTSVGTFRGWEDNVDEVAIFNTDQRANISSIYNSGIPTTISGATAYWKLGEQATFSTNWTVPDQVGSSDGTSANMTIEDRVGDAPNSSTNAVSFNMEEADISNDTP